jgi:hypothetical protein
MDPLCLAASNPFLSQLNDDTQPALMLIEGKLESEVEKIMAEVTY